MTKKKNVRPAVVASSYNKPIVEKLVEGAFQGFQKSGINKKNVHVFWVPGAFEIPVLAKQLASTKKYDCIVCVGCVIKGETHHFDYVAQGACTGIQAASLATGIPMTFSVLLCDTPEQAWRRAGGKINRGFEGAMTALEMANLLQSAGRKQRSKN